MIHYGKAEISVYRTDGVRSLLGAEVELDVFGENFMPAYTEGDNRLVVATDTMKNFVHAAALDYEGGLARGADRTDRRALPRDLRVHGADPRPSSRRTRTHDVRAVDGVDLEIRPGEVLGLVGESGSGKSVTARSIMRLVPMPPGKLVSGRILFHGQDLTSLREREMEDLRGSRISMIFQDPMTFLNPLLTAGEQVSEAIRRHQGLDRTAARDEVLRLFREVGIPSPELRYGAYPHQLSGGLRQRVMIAMALSSRPELLIADEPTTALDVTIQAQILALLRDLQQRVRDEHPAHHARPGCRRGDLRPRRGDVRRAHRRASTDRCPLRRSRAPIHSRADERHPAPGSSRCRAAADRRCATGHGPPAIGMSVPSALSLPGADLRSTTSRRMREVAPGHAGGLSFRGEQVVSANRLHAHAGGRSG